MGGGWFKAWLAVLDAMQGKKGSDRPQPGLWHATLHFISEPVAGQEIQPRYDALHSTSHFSFLADYWIQ